MPAVWQPHILLSSFDPATTAALAAGRGAMALGVLFRSFNVSFLVGWAFNIAASANLPALIMLLFWPRTTKQGIIAAVTAGMLSSLGWILLSGDTFEKVYGWSREASKIGRAHV